MRTAAAVAAQPRHTGSRCARALHQEPAIENRRRHGVTAWKAVAIKRKERALEQRPWTIEDALQFAVQRDPSADSTKDEQKVAPVLLDREQKHDQRQHTNGEVDPRAVRSRAASTPAAPARARKRFVSAASRLSSGVSEVPTTLTTSRQSAAAIRARGNGRAPRCERSAFAARSRHDQDDAAGQR